MQDDRQVPTLETERVSTVRRLVRRFENCTLPREEWTHEAHVRIALWYLIDEGVAGAIRRLRRNIRRYNRITGGDVRERAAYHETVTLFSLWMIECWRTANAYPVGPCVRNVLFRRLEGAPILETQRILRHYSSRRLFRAGARVRFVPPDRSRLPQSVARRLEAVSRPAAA